ncbi:MAG: cysteine synthase family protein [Planctomycetota bacterium]
MSASPTRRTAGILPAVPPPLGATLDDIAPLIGHTPLLQINYLLDGRPRWIFAKYEQENMTGSVKDRMAEYILRKGYESRELRRGDTLVEASSGNTGISFAAIGRALGHPVRIYMPNWMSQERVRLIQSLGAEIIPVSAEQGGFLGSIRLAEEYAAEHNHVFLPRQFDNPVNIDAHYESTGPEIEAQLAALGLRADAFVAGVGTGGTVMGVGRYLRRDGRRVRVHPLEPANSPTMRTGCKVGVHRIQGISDEFIPSIVKLDELDPVVDAWDGDSILMAQDLCAQLGLAVGISSGANFLGAAKVLEDMLAARARSDGRAGALHERGAESAADLPTVVTLLPDCNKKYLSTDLCRREPIGDDYLTPRIKLERFKAIRMPGP